jgi:hypothetical protein
MLRDDEYVRLQTILLATARHSECAQERARWLALVQACQEELMTAAETHSKRHAHWQKAA